MEFASFKTVSEMMSAWPKGTTADLGLHVFSQTREKIFSDSALGMINLILCKEELTDLNSLIRHNSSWVVNCQYIDETDYQILLVKWLEEVLYKLEVNQQLLVDCQVKLIHSDSTIQCESHVSWVNSDNVNKELEIKAITSHELILKLLLKGEIISPEDDDVPQFIGPGWYSSILFDI